MDELSMKFDAAAGRREHPPYSLGDRLTLLTFMRMPVALASDCIDHPSGGVGGDGLDGRRQLWIGLPLAG